MYSSFEGFCVDLLTTSNCADQKSLKMGQVWSCLEGTPVSHFAACFQWQEAPKLGNVLDSSAKQAYLRHRRSPWRPSGAGLAKCGQPWPPTTGQWMATERLSARPVRQCCRSGSAPLWPGTWRPGCPLSFQFAVPCQVSGHCQPPPPRSIIFQIALRHSNDIFPLMQQAHLTWMFWGRESRLPSAPCPAPLPPCASGSPPTMLAGCAEARMPPGLPGAGGHSLRALELITPVNPKAPSVPRKESCRIQSTPPQGSE